MTAWGYNGYGQAGYGDTTQRDTTGEMGDNMQFVNIGYTLSPTGEPTVSPTDDPTAEPTADPTDDPTEDPTTEPTEQPTPAPTRCSEAEMTTVDWYQLVCAHRHPLDLQSIDGLDVDLYATDSITATAMWPLICCMNTMSILIPRRTRSLCLRRWSMWANPPTANWRTATIWALRIGSTCSRSLD